MPYICMMLGNASSHSQAAWAVLFEEIRACAAAEEAALDILDKGKAVPKTLQDLIGSIVASEACFTGMRSSLSIAEVVSE